MMKIIAMTFIVLCGFYMNAYINKIKEKGGGKDE